MQSSQILLIFLICVLWCVGGVLFLMGFVKVLVAVSASSLAFLIGGSILILVGFGLIFYVRKLSAHNYVGRVLGPGQPVGQPVVQSFVQPMPQMNVVVAHSSLGRPTVNVVSTTTTAPSQFGFGPTVSTGYVINQCPTAVVQPPLPPTNANIGAASMAPPPYTDCIRESNQYTNPEKPSPSAPYYYPS